MWWAVLAERLEQVIQDRWCVACGNASEHLIPNADGDPTATETLVSETVDRCNMACLKVKTEPLN